MQVSDRFHLFKNLNDYATDALQKLFQGRIAIPITPGTQNIRYEVLIGTKTERIRLVKKLRGEGRNKGEISLLTGLSVPMVKKYIDIQECDIPKEKQTVRGREHEDAVRKLSERSDRVKELNKAGLSMTEITQKTGFTAAIVRIYLSADFSPVNAHYGKQREGKLQPFREDVLLWKAEGLTYREIHEGIREKGYSGTQDAIRGFISKERRIRSGLQAAVIGDQVEFIDKKWLIRLLYKPIEDVKGISPMQLAAIFDSYPLAKSILDIVSEFKTLIKVKDPLSLLSWMEKALALGVAELETFINGLKQDIDAVINAITSDFSNGLVEGTVNKIKVIKRIMYGRCQFDLLRNKCLLLDYGV
jgi:predicted transcriptional regulator